jgi:ribose transport system ATP-binding protein
MRPVLELRQLSKTFGGARALDDVSLSIRPGEVHGLLGENGSGKSTLIKILNGFHAPDSGGELEVGGEPVKLPLRPGQFRELGLSFVHQDLGLVLDLSVVENLRVAQVVARSGVRIDWRDEYRKARETFERYGLSIDPAQRVDALSETGRALLAIVRAVEEIRLAQAAHARTGGLLVLDEPTVFLPRDGVEQLFSIIRGIVASGDASVLFVSHDLDEVRQITDRVTVLRDGRLQGTLVTAEASDQDLVEMIVGRRLAELGAPEHAPAGGEPGLVATNVAGGSVEHVDLTVNRGETVGLTGLRGAGWEDLPYLLFGGRPARSGTLSAGDTQHELPSLTPTQAVELGLALLPADRQRDASVPGLTLGENVMLQVLDRYGSRTGLRLGALNAGARAKLEELDVRPPEPHAAFGSLSGGNQQKAVLAKWLQSEPDVLLLHEPTQGVDIGARQHIFGILRDVAASGTSIVCSSSDFEQLAAVCDRVLVFGRGRVVSELRGDDVTKERIAERVYNSVTLRESTGGDEEAA